MDAAILKALPLLALETIRQAMSDMITHSAKLPKEWKTAQIILWPKEGNPQDPANYRPTSLLQVLYKVYTNIITKRLSKALNKYVLNKSQMGFRKGMSPQSALRCLTNIIEEANFTQKELHLTYIDCKKAFDSIHQEAIFIALEKYGVSEKMILTIRQLYKNCNSHLVINNSQGKNFNIERGVRQGDTLSPLLFITTINGILDWIEDSQEGYVMMQGLKIGALAYCDDIVLVAPSKKDTKKLFKKLKAFCEWAGLEINPKKSAYTNNCQIINKPTTKTSLLVTENNENGSTTSAITTISHTIQIHGSPVENRPELGEPANIP